MFVAIATAHSRERPGSERAADRVPEDVVNGTLGVTI
jgi:hypothetical protein